MCGQRARFAGRPHAPPSGRIVLDASFQPRAPRRYAVESARVGRLTDLDKLVLDIESQRRDLAEEAVARPPVS